MILALPLPLPLRLLLQRRLINFYYSSSSSYSSSCCHHGLYGGAHASANIMCERVQSVIKPRKNVANYPELLALDSKIMHKA